MITNAKRVVDEYFMQPRIWWFFSFLGMCHCKPYNDSMGSLIIKVHRSHTNILSRATFPRAPSYGDMRAWVEGSQTRKNRALRALAEASNLLGYNAQHIRLIITD